ncbi:hypothetical protein [uncultured Sulfitobacter sp.]|uniref:hypothetical protein n=1 Tax=uncultured Sulfitobacter sp. TaxID=191468 RepID=UPI00260E8414|nr:hypothetical protein [uncultured Sulfitobacter sp.]
MMMLRLKSSLSAAAILSCALATQATAWEFTPGMPCVLTHQSGDVAVTLTYDPVTPLYSISLKQTEGFPAAPTFGLRFDGDLPIAIGTDRHQFTDDRRRVTVEDSGFGNVLNGLQFNKLMTAFVGAQVISVPLNGAAEPVAAFRACEAPLPTS